MTSYVLAAIDDSAATGPVLRVAAWFAAMLGVDVVALHVAEDANGITARASANAAGVQFVLRDGDPVATLHDVACDTNVCAVVVGARGLPLSTTLAGHVALELIRTITKPVLVVPPDARIPTAAGLSVLAPLDDHQASADALRQVLAQMRPAADLAVVLLRVFTAEDLPRFADHVPYDAALFARALARRIGTSVTTQTRVETRVGHPAHTILAAERELACDLVILAWDRKLAEHHAAVVKRVLAHTRTPLLLLPASKHPDTADAATTAHTSDHDHHQPHVAATPNPHRKTAQTIIAARPCPTRVSVEM
jgi:nucleotide-binding universal stress UspA family protein